MDVDALDAELLEIMARRMALVAELAAYKRLHGQRVRDARLGLPRSESESMFRTLLRASRDQQAALRTAARLDFAPRTVAVVGGGRRRRSR